MMFVVWWLHLHSHLCLIYFTECFARISNARSVKYKQTNEQTNRWVLTHPRDHELSKSLLRT